MAKRSLPRRKVHPAVTFRDRVDNISGELLGAQAAVMTTIAAIEHRCRVDDLIATNLRRAALTPIGTAIEMVHALVGRRS